MNWRAWFAWHPVITIGGHFAWLRKVERRLVKRHTVSFIHPDDRGEPVTFYEHEYRLRKAEGLT